MKDINEQLSSKTVAIRPSGIRKFFDIVSTMKDAISLGVGEPDFDTPWPIREEGIYSLDGAEMPSLQKGINVVKFSNGEVKKVIVK